MIAGTGLVGAAAPRASSAQTVAAEVLPLALTAEGPAFAHVKGSFAYSGVLTAADIGVPLQPVELLADGESVGFTTTGMDGSYSIVAAFPGPGVYEVAAVAAKGTPVEVTSPELVVVVGPTTLVLEGPAYADSAAGASSYAATLTAGSDPVPGQLVTVTVDGSPLPPAVTQEDGVAEVPVDFAAPGILDLAASTLVGTPAEAHSAVLSVVVGPGVLTLSGPGFANSTGTFVYEGVLSFGGEPLAGADVEILVGAALAASVTTDAAGGYGLATTLGAPGIKTISALALPGTAAETASSPLNVVVGPGSLSLAGPATAARNTPVSFTGTLTVGGTQMSAQPVRALVDGVVKGNATTSAAGAYSVPVTFAKRGTFSVTTDAFAGTPAATTSASRSVAVDSFTSIASGNEHSCGLQTDGTVWCWGSNQFGQLGDGTQTSRATPVKVQGVSGAFKIAVGGWTSCALATQVFCWGDNGNAQLGRGYYGGPVPTAGPVAVFGGNFNAISLAVGTHHACAVANTHAVYCWGANWNGQLGLGWAGGGYVTTPTALGFSAMATGHSPITVSSNHTCVVKDGNVFCWGQNANGQLGVNDHTMRVQPTPVWPPFTSALGVSAGAYAFTCAVLQTGQVPCWGDGSQGQLGTGATFSTNRNNVAAQGISTAVQVSAGGTHACALLGDGSVRCWGRGVSGQLGDGTTTNRLSPVAMLGISTADPSDPGSYGWRGLAAGGDHTCVKLVGGGARCVGAGSFGQLGNGQYSPSGTTVEVL